MADNIETLQERKEFLSHCVRCSLCKFVPTPKSHPFASACPSIDWGTFHNYSASGQIIAGYAFMTGTTKPSEEALRAVYSCTMCGACDTSCKIILGETVEPLDSLYALRSYLAKEGHSPTSHQAIVKNLREHGNRAGRPRGERDHWAKGMNLALTSAERGAVLIHVGEELSYNEAHWPALRKIVKTLIDAGIPVVYGGQREGATGGLAYDLGHVDEARTQAQGMLDMIRKSGVSKVVTCSAEALAAFRALYPKMGLSLEGVQVLHITEYLEELCAEDRIRIRKTTSGRATYHDPCKLGRLSEPARPRDAKLGSDVGYLVSRDAAAVRFGNDGCYEAPRSIMQRLGFELVELERSKMASYCCGGGGGVPDQNPAAAQQAAQSRIKEVKSSGVDLCLTACAGCSSHLQGAGGSAGAGIQVKDLMAFVAEAIEATPTRA